MKSQFDEIYKIILKIPKGKVATYGQIAALSGNPGAARTVGWALNNLKEGSLVPWHRVINAKGSSSFPLQSKRRLQQALLEAEGVVFNLAGKVDLGQYQWNGRNDKL
jgi:methylated-DNA-protein-cysteine methyltransferase-like protein